jgi:hypothetical protein
MESAVQRGELLTSAFPTLAGLVLESVSGSGGEGELPGEAGENGGGSQQGGGGGEARTESLVYLSEKSSRELIDFLLRPTTAPRLFKLERRILDLLRRRSISKSEREDLFSLLEEHSLRREQKWLSYALLESARDEGDLRTILERLERIGTLQGVWNDVLFETKLPRYLANALAQGLVEVLRPPAGEVIDILSLQVITRRDPFVYWLLSPSSLYSEDERRILTHRIITLTEQLPIDLRWSYSDFQLTSTIREGSLGGTYEGTEVGKGAVHRAGLDLTVSSSEH